MVCQSCTAAFSSSSSAVRRPQQSLHEHVSPQQHEQQGQQASRHISALERSAPGLPALYCIMPRSWPIGGWVKHQCERCPSRTWRADRHIRWRAMTSEIWTPSLTIPTHRRPSTLLLLGGWAMYVAAAVEAARGCDHFRCGRGAAVRRRRGRQFLS